VHIYDAVGNYISKMNLYCLDDAAAATQLVRTNQPEPEPKPEPEPEPSNPNPNPLTLTRTL